MANPAIGHAPCPLGELVGDPHQAEVVRESKGRKALYFRCDCGSLQPRSDEGQARMEAGVRAGVITLTDGGPEPAPAAEPEPAGATDHKQAAGLGRTLAGFLTTEDEPDE